MTTPDASNKKRQLRIEMPANSSAIYSNSVMISHTNNEVIFDFIQILPNDPRARVQQRVVMTPLHAKLFMKALADNVQKYEAKNGEIKLPSRPQSLAEQLFQGIQSGKRSDDTEDDDSEDETDEES